MIYSLSLGQVRRRSLAGVNGTRANRIGPVAHDNATTPFGTVTTEADHARERRPLNNVTISFRSVQTDSFIGQFARKKRKTCARRTIDSENAQK